MDQVETFQVKDVCKICNVTRKALLVYEEKGLLIPYRVNSENGYRYYNAENISKIMYIRKFQSFGFSLEDIYEYLHDTKKMAEVYERLNRLKLDLEEVIAELHMRMMTEEYHNQEIVKTRLPAVCCFAERKVTHSFREALEFLRETHLSAIQTGFADKAARMCTAVLSSQGEYPDLFGTCEMLYCIPMAEGYEGEKAIKVQATTCLSIYHRGSYSTLMDSEKALLDYCKTGNIQPTGPMRFIWLEGPPVHGAQEEKYLTQIALPIGK